METDKSDDRALLFLAVMTAAYLLFLWDMRKRSIESDKRIVREYKSTIAELGDHDAG